MEWCGFRVESTGGFGGGGVFGGDRGKGVEVVGRGRQARQAAQTIRERERERESCEVLLHGVRRKQDGC